LILAGQRPSSLNASGLIVVGSSSPNSDRRVLAQRPSSDLHEGHVSSIMRWRNGLMPSRNASMVVHMC